MHFLPLLFLLSFQIFNVSIIRAAEAKCDYEIIEGTFAFPLNFGASGYESLSSSEDELDIENGLCQSENDCHFRLKSFLQNDRHFKRSFPFEKQRKLFFDSAFDSLKEEDETYHKQITVGKLLKVFPMDDLFLAECVLKYIDRQPCDILPDYSQSQLAINKFTRSIIKHNCSNHRFWMQLVKILDMLRSDLLAHVNNLPFISDHEKELFKSYNLEAKRNNLLLSTPLALLPTCYWYLARLHIFHPGSNLVEIALIYSMFLYFIFTYAYEHFLFERYVK